MKLIFVAFILLCSVLHPLTVSSFEFVQADELDYPASLLNNEFDALLDGYDPTTFFPDDHPDLDVAPDTVIEVNDIHVGNPEISAIFNGALFYFESEENKQKFLANPAAFFPKYGGWCAKAMAFGMFFPITPSASRLIADQNNKLVHFAFAANSAAESFVKPDLETSVQSADGHWQTKVEEASQ